MSPATVFTLQLILGYGVWLLCFRAYIWPRLKAMNRIDAHRVLSGKRGNRGHGVAAEHGHGLDVGLDAGATTAVGAGDDQDTRRAHGYAQAAFTASQI